jgi:hypothetical protein
LYQLKYKILVQLVPYTNKDPVGKVQHAHLLKETRVDGFAGSPNDGTKWDAMVLREKFLTVGQKSTGGEIAATMAATAAPSPSKPSWLPPKSLPPRCAASRKARRGDDVVAVNVQAEAAVVAKVELL